jgi:succinate dehydrogenase/fumarate reductase flavoprotein subunit
MSAAMGMATPDDCDLLVIGSGAGGLSAAVTATWHGLKVIVAEKEPVFGGTTAWSGGWMWAPRNPLAKRAGITEGPEAPRNYLRHVLGNNFDEAKVTARAVLRLESLNQKVSHSNLLACRHRWLPDRSTSSRRDR